MSGSKPKDIFGQRFGRLVAIRRVENIGQRAAWLCACECGGQKTVDGVRLRNGAVKSCGCWKRDHPARLRHGHNRQAGCTKTYNSWHHMRDRCLNPSSGNWRHYGGRGITIFAAWEAFENFLADMGECPPGHTIDRIDVNGNYEPSNCRWATPTVQARNVRRSVKLTLNGETKTAFEWAEIVGIEAKTLSMRKLRGWSDHDALTWPLGIKRPRK